MTPLKALILKALKQHGPLSDLGLYSHIGDEHTGGASMIVIACLELKGDGFIEPLPNDPNLWQLSNQGLEFLSALRDNPREEKFPLPAVEIAGETPVMRRYLVLEIRGGDPQTNKSWYGLAELDLEQLQSFLTQGLLQEYPARIRKNPPQVIIHKPTGVEA